MIKTNRRNNKKKWASSEQKQQSMALERDWNSLKLKWDSAKPKLVSIDKSATVKVKLPSSDDKPKSLNSWVTGPVSSKPRMQYTGSEMLGISQMPKSNAVPVFKVNHILDIARMRR